MIWCGSTEIYFEPSDVHSSIEKFEEGLRNDSPDISPSMIYAYAAIKLGFLMQMVLQIYLQIFLH